MKSQSVSYMIKVDFNIFFFNQRRLSYDQLGSSSYFHFINELCDVHGIVLFKLHLGTGPVILLSFSVSGGNVHRLAI